MKSFAKKYIKSKYLYAWIAANVVSALIANAIAFIQLSSYQPYKTPDVTVTAIEISLLIGLVEGLSQWLVLRGFVRKSQLWIVLTALGSLISTRFSILLSSLTMLLLASSPSSYYVWQGLSFWGALPLPLLQWLFLRKHVEKAWLWIIFSLIAKFWTPQLLGVGGSSIQTLTAILASSILIGTSTLDISRLVFVEIVAVIAGIITGAITAIPMIYFVEDNRRDVEQERH